MGKMGICYSGPGEAERGQTMRPRSTSSTRTNSAYLDNVNLRVDSPERHDEESINTIKNDLFNNPEIFVLNNILLSVMFFEDYQKDIRKLIQTNATQIEKELNPILRKNEIKKCIVPDVICENVSKNVLYRPLHGPKKINSEPLVARRIFVVNDDIEVLDSMDAPQYSEIDTPRYRAQMEDSKHKGFVKLRLLEASRCPKLEESNILETSTINTTHYQDEDEDYAYTTITMAKTPKPLDINIENTRRNTLPDACFSLRKVKRDVMDSINDSDDDEEEISEDRVYKIVSYINSEGFMEFFQNTAFPNSLAEALGFRHNEIFLAKSIPGVIFCDLIDENENSIPCEIIPAVSIQWPKKHAFEFENRERTTVADIRQGTLYRWPTYEMLEDIKMINCVLMPKGNKKKRGLNLDDEIEWEIGFPKTERYIETRMNHAQMKCFLYLVTLYKTYIEPVTTTHGLLLEHIRTQLYWECESNYKLWPEHRLGTKLLNVIKNLNQKLSKGVLQNYFIKQKNELDNIPKKYIQHAQRMFHNISEAPVMYFIKALRNLRYVNGAKFYPPLDFKELYEILLEGGTRSTNPQLIERQLHQIKRRKAHDPEQILKLQTQNKIKEKILQQRMNESKQKEENLNDRRKVSVDSINLDWICEKNFEIMKVRSLLLFFLKHYIEIAKKSSKLGSQPQAAFYLKQAWYLAKILEEIPSCIYDAEEFIEVIAKEEENVRRAAAEEPSLPHPPSTPQRNTQFNYEAVHITRNPSDVSQNSRTVHNNTSAGKINIRKRSSSNSRNKTTTIITSLKEEEGPTSLPENRVTRKKSVAFVAEVSKL